MLTIVTAENRTSKNVATLEIMTAPLRFRVRHSQVFHDLKKALRAYSDAIPDSSAREAFAEKAREATEREIARLSERHTMPK